MVKLLLISDDFTGALDTGIQFVQYGAKTKIITTAYAENYLFVKDEVEVLVIDAQTRHLTGEQAYQKVFKLVKSAIAAGIPHIYKKTDSGLRGNIGSELKALLDASEELFLPFIPAYPQMNRITIQGYHYVDGQPIRESVFGKDPFEPVVSSKVQELFDKSSTRIELFEKGSEYYTSFDRPVIGIYDAQTDKDILEITKDLNEKKQLRIMAGCAGFASALPEFMNFQKQSLSMPELDQSLLVMCGSINPISKAQIEYAETKGFKRIILSPKLQLEKGYLDSKEGRLWLRELEELFSGNPVVMLDTGTPESEVVKTYMQEHDISLHEARERISLALGEIVKKLLDINYRHSLMVIGGDTLLGFFTQIGCNEIYPEYELEAGSVLSHINYKDNIIWIISKSGGFGKEDVIYQLAGKLHIAGGAIC